MCLGRRWYIHQLTITMHTALVTLFTRQNCSLCATAKMVLQDLQRSRTFDYHEVDLMTRGHERWKKIYEFDVPVVWVLPPKRQQRYCLIFQIRYMSNEFYILTQNLILLLSPRNCFIVSLKFKLRNLLKKPRAMLDPKKLLASKETATRSFWSNPQVSPHRPEAILDTASLPTLSAEWT